MSPRANLSVALRQPRGPLDRVVAIGTVHRLGAVLELPQPLAVRLAAPADVLYDGDIAALREPLRHADIGFAVLHIRRAVHEHRVPPRLCR